jgi:hypothetical protein
MPTVYDAIGQERLAIEKLEARLEAIEVSTEAQPRTTISQHGQSRGWVHIHNDERQER